MEQHYRRLEETLKFIEKSEIKLNLVKCELRKSTLRYFRHIISDKGIQPRKDKIEEILKLLPRSANPELKSFPGMTIFRQIYAESNRSTTVNVKEKAFQRVKEFLTQTPILTMIQVSRS